MTTKQELLSRIANSVRRKHPWKIQQERYLNLFHEYPKEFLEERAFYDNLVAKSKSFKKCSLRLEESVKPEIQLTLDELITWELSLDKWEDAQALNILPGDIKKILKEIQNE